MALALSIGRCGRLMEGQLVEIRAQRKKRVETRGVVSDVAISKRGRGELIFLPYVISSLSLRTSNYSEFTQRLILM